MNFLSLYCKGIAQRSGDLAVNEILQDDGARLSKDAPVFIRLAYRRASSRITNATIDTHENQSRAKGRELASAFLRRPFLRAESMLRL